MNLTIESLMNFVPRRVMFHLSFNTNTGNNHAKEKFTDSASVFTIRQNCYFQSFHNHSRNEGNQLFYFSMLPKRTYGLKIYRSIEMKYFFRLKSVFSWARNFGSKVFQGNNSFHDFSQNFQTLLGSCNSKVNSGKVIIFVFTLEKISIKFCSSDLLGKNVFK